MICCQLESTRLSGNRRAEGVLNEQVSDMSSHQIAAILIAAGSAFVVTPALADVLILRNGGRLEGDVAKTQVSSESKAVAYTVKLNSGVRLKIDGREVRKHIKSDPTELEYEKLLNAMPDTAAGHWTMANWCNSNKLSEQRRYHQEQVLRHDPNHEDARRSLGYTRLNGKWGTRKDRMRDKGYELFEGKYLLPQQIAILKRTRDDELAQKKWRRDLKTWRKNLSGASKAEILDQFANIDDPRAVLALHELLQNDSSSQFREIYVDNLARIGGPGAVSALVQAGLEDSEVEVRLRAIDRLREIAPLASARMFARALTSKSNRTINRAGVALGRLGEREAILPLIDALVTRHETIKKPANQINSSFSRSGDGSLGLGGLNVGGGPKKIVKNLQNKSVLEALVALTEQNYQYSKNDWKRWYIGQQDLGDINLRRDS